MAQMQKPAIPKGTRDFSPLQMAGRNYIFDTIKSVFKRFGYKCIETPAMENLSTLLGKYGQEGDKLLFKILNSGDAFAKVNLAEYASANEVESNRLSLAVCEKGLRYDLTVPFARYVVQHRNEITFPFKRYQIQPVWRADRPQKGRYREFYQCDVDVIGSTSLLNELELVQIADMVFNRLGIDVCIKINNRKILSGLAEAMGSPDKIVEITIAMDKIEKIGLQAVKEELFASGINDEGFAVLEPVLSFKGERAEKIKLIKSILSSSEVGLKGIEELERLFAFIDNASITQSVELDLSLARGLNYYTGAIFEVKAKDFEIGSICGGGRYDNLTGIFGLSDVSGVGISFGADRIYDVLAGLNKFPQDATTATDALFANMGEGSLVYALSAISSLREAGISVELYPDNAKLKKQFEYAEKNNIPYMIIAGESEMAAGVYNLKNLQTGEQQALNLSQMLSLLNG